jgi:hypothetical protein
VPFRVCARHVREKQSEARLAKEMHMISLDTERSYRPDVRFTDTADFLVEKRCQLPNQNLCAVCGTPDKMVGYFVGDMFALLCIHTHQYNLFLIPVKSLFGPPYS